MPELPEVETLRRDLERELIGRRLVAVDVTGLRSIRRHRDTDSFAGRILDRPLSAVDRRGKFLLLGLEAGTTLVVHLGMSGQLLLSKADQPRRRHTHVVFDFGSGIELRFVDPRTFGQLFVATPVAGNSVAELAHLGPDPLRDLDDWRRLAAMVERRRTKLKPLLMDQRFVAGIGNMYADEILFGARLHPDRAAASLAPGDVRRLHRSLRQTLLEAIEHRGSSLADEQYRDLYGEIGGYQLHHSVYGREGQPCPRCRRPIRRTKSGGRSTFSCPACQG